MSQFGYRGYALNPLDIPFEKRVVHCIDSNGSYFTKWVAVGMPKLGQYSRIQDVAVFLYESREAALVGKNSGGTGFLIAIASERWSSQVRHVHAVTNWHVAVGEAPSASVVRINTNSGLPAIFRP